MSRPENKKKGETPPILPIQPSDAPAEVPRSGAGAGSALFAMLKKRQMGVTRDVETDPQTPGATTRSAEGD